jgi:hypothetical protein
MEMELPVISLSVSFLRFFYNGAIDRQYIIRMCPLFSCIVC